MSTPHMSGGIQMVIDSHHFASVRWDLRGLVGRIRKVIPDMPSSSGVIWMKLPMGWRGGVPNPGVLDCVCIFGAESVNYTLATIWGLHLRKFGACVQECMHVVRLPTSCVLTWWHALAEGGGICPPYMLHFLGWHIC